MRPAVMSSRRIGVGDDGGVNDVGAEPTSIGATTTIPAIIILAGIGAGRTGGGDAGSTFASTSDEVERIERR